MKECSDDDDDYNGIELLSCNLKITNRLVLMMMMLTTMMVMLSDNSIIIMIKQAM